MAWAEVQARIRTVSMCRFPRDLAWLVPVAALGACRDAAPARARTNVVLIVVDTLRADVVLDPEGRVATPTLDGLAGDGVLFPLAFSHAPMTLPSHTALFSSRLPHQTGVLVNGQLVPEDLPLLGPHLAQQGYQTTAIVSLDTLWRRSGKETTLDRGFAHYERAPGAIGTAEAVTERVAAALDGLASDRPFFLFAHYADPHEPYAAHGSIVREADLLLNGELVERVSTSDPASWNRELALPAGRSTFEIRADHSIDLRFLQCFRGGQRVEVEFLEGGVRSQGPVVRFALDNPEAGDVRVSFFLADRPPLAEHRQRYRREVEYADLHVGVLLQELKERGLYEEALIVFTSDHGESLNERGGSGHAHHLHDELVRVPLIVKPPASSTARETMRARREQLATHIDLVPTILELLGQPPLPGQQGRSLLAPPAPTVAFSETHFPEANHDYLALRDEAWKLIYVADEDRFQLYDLAADPREVHNVFRQSGERFVDWQKQLREAAEHSQDFSLDVGSIDPEALEKMRAIGYFGR